MQLTDDLSFLQEAQIISQLHDRNIVSIYAFGQWQNTPYIAMEFVAGSSLQSLLRENQPLDVQCVLKTGIQICSALSHAHKQGIVHRDLKPANIMIGANGDVKVIDFGFAKIFQADAARRQQQLTEAGCALGTTLYMSPEQCQGQPVDGRADLYGLGCVLHHCLTGRPPFEGDHSVAIMFKHINEQAPRLVGADTELKQVAELQRILDTAMARDLGSRYQTAEEMHHDLSLAATNITVLKVQAGSPSKETIGQIPDQQQVNPLIAQRLVLPLIMILSMLIMFAFFQFTPLTKSTQPTQGDDPTSGNLTQAQYLRQLQSLHGIERLEFMKTRSKRIDNFPGRDTHDRFAISSAVHELHGAALRQITASQQPKAFELLLLSQELLLALPQSSATNGQKLICWADALYSQQNLPPSQRSPNITALTEQFIGTCRAETPAEVLVLMECIIRLDQLGYPDCALQLCPLAARGLKQIKPLSESKMLLCVERAGAIRRLAKQRAHKETERLIVSVARRWADNSNDPVVLAELSTWTPRSDFPNLEERILDALRITDPASIYALKMNMRLITAYRETGKLESAERLAANALESFAKFSPSQQSEAQKAGLQYKLYCEAIELRLQLKKPVIEILAVLKYFPPTDRPEERLFRSIYYARTYVLARNYAKAQETIDAALGLKGQLKDASQSDDLCNVLVYAGYLAQKRGDKSSAESYWQSAKNIASILDVSYPGRLALWKQSVDDYRKDRPEPELFK